jgi:hypothetical protein
VSVSGGGAATASASDSTTVVAATTYITAFNNSTGTTAAGLSITLVDTVTHTQSTCATPCPITGDDPLTVTLTQPQQIPSVGAGSQAVFASWSDGGVQGHTIQPGANVTVNFTAQYQLTLAASPSAGGTFLVDLCGGCQNPTSWTSPNTAWYAAGTPVWVTAQANSGFGFITLNNGPKQQEIVLNSPMTVTANFSSNVLTVSVSPTPKVTAGGSSFTAHASGPATASSGTTYNNDYGSDGTTLGDFSCYSVIAQIEAAISNITNNNGNISFDVAFLAGESAAPGEYDMTCSCNYFECYIDIGSVEVEPAAPTITISTSNPLWFFGAGNAPPPDFTLGDVKTTLTASGMPSNGGSFAWTITAGSSKASFSANSAQSTITTQVASVVLYSSSWSTAQNDVTVSMTWTDASGNPYSAVTLNLQIDSPYKFILDPTVNTNPKNTGMDASNQTCYTPNPTVGTGGYQSIWYYRLLSFFGVLISHAYLNESFGAVQVGSGGQVAGFNWNTDWKPNPGETPDGTLGDYICSWNTTGNAVPIPLNPQNPLLATIVLSATHAWSVGSLTGVGVPVETDTQQKLIDHGLILSVVSPVR